MNCSVCGSPLLFDRVVFRCACGTYVHAYCLDKHIIGSHRPELEEGYADLNGEFHLKFQPVAAVAAIAAPEEEASTAQHEDDGATDEDFVPGEQVVTELEQEQSGDAEQDEDS